MPILECNNLTKTYAGVTALDHIDLAIDPGRIVGLLGPNGSGKTTLIKLAAGLLQPTQGQILIDGKKPSPETNAVLSYLPERIALSQWMKVTQVLDFFCDFYKDFDRAAAEAMLECDVHACTDVTGFGLAGHLHEMLEASGCAARLDWEALPLFDGVYELSCDYCRPGKTFGIIDWANAFVEQGGIDDFEFDDRMGVLCDPQTSGGLLVAIPPENASHFEVECEQRQGRKPSRIGAFEAGPAGKIFVNW